MSQFSITWWTCIKHWKRQTTANSVLVQKNIKCSAKAATMTAFVISRWLCLKQWHKRWGAMCIYIFESWRGSRLRNFAVFCECCISIAGSLGWIDSTNMRAVNRMLRLLITWWKRKKNKEFIFLNKFHSKVHVSSRQFWIINRGWCEGRGPCF